MKARIHRALLRTAAFLVPGPQRAEWLAEWQAELCYVRDNCRTSFCLGAFRDGFWLRRHHPAPVVYLQSPWECLAVLAIAAALSLFFAARSPIVRELFFPAPYATHLATISNLSAEDYQSLSRDGQFSELAYYRLIRTSVAPVRPRRGKLVVALASRNLFPLLGVPVAAAAAPGSSALMVSDAAWRDYFDRDPQVVGRRLQLAGKTAQVTAVIANWAWRLPGHPDAWLLVDDDRPGDARGFALVRALHPARHIAIGEERFECVPVPQVHAFYLAGILLAVGCIVLPSVTSLSLGEYPANGANLRRWIFLAAKIALILPVGLFGALDLLSLIAVSLQAQGAIVGIVVGLRWALVDQRRRCPICLRVLTHPTSIGEVSHTFLEWYGTELMCTRGHGLLHVPELLNGYSTQRWQHLDSSWSSLFS